MNRHRHMSNCILYFITVSNILPMCIVSNIIIVHHTQIMYLYINTSRVWIYPCMMLYVQYISQLVLEFLLLQLHIQYTIQYCVCVLIIQVNSRSPVIYSKYMNEKWIYRYKSKCFAYWWVSEREADLGLVLSLTLIHVMTSDHVCLSFICFRYTWGI